MQYLVFDVRADLAQFKKPFTTMSPQTFSIPSGTAIIGMLAAIIGLDKKEYWQYFPANSYRLAIGVRKPIKKVVIPINTLKTTQLEHFSRFEEHKRTTMEFIKDGIFRIWFNWDDEELFHRMVTMVRNHRTHYTISLGLAWNLANYEYQGMFDSYQTTGEANFSEINSIIRKDKLIEIDFKDRIIYSCRLPVRMKPDNSRVVEQYSDYLFENNGRPVLAKVTQYLTLSNGERIVPI